MNPFSAICSRLSAAALVLTLPLRAQDTNFVRDTNVAVPMRDGVILRADIWRPGGPGPFPVLVYRTPYNKAHATAAQSTARRAVQRGYAVVMQDVRGRYASDGEYIAYQQEGHDGYDTRTDRCHHQHLVGRYGRGIDGILHALTSAESL